MYVKFKDKGIIIKKLEEQHSHLALIYSDMKRLSKAYIKTKNKDKANDFMIDVTFTINQLSKEINNAIGHLGHLGTWYTEIQTVINRLEKIRTDAYSLIIKGYKTMLPHTLLSRYEEEIMTYIKELVALLEKSIIVFV